MNFPLYIDVVYCHCNFEEKHFEGGIRFQTFLVNFWLQAVVDLGPTMSVIIHAPLIGNPVFFSASVMLVVASSIFSVQPEHKCTPVSKCSSISSSPCPIFSFLFLLTSFGKFAD